MEIGIVGLGRMGAGIARRLMRGGHICVVYDQDAHAMDQLINEGARSAKDIEDIIHQLAAPRAIWVMLPAGEPTEAAIALAGRGLSAGDTIIDGGNTHYRDDIRRARGLRDKGVDYIDIGTSGGIWGLERGYCLMIGGDKDAVRRLDPILKTLAPGLGQIARTNRPKAADPRAEQGYLHAGPAGAGHFVKMVHNGIEYGLMQAYAEGFDILKNKNADVLPDDERFELNLTDISEVWRRGSVLSSWLLDLSAQALAKDPALEAFTGSVEDNGEARWTIEAAVDESVPVHVLAAADRPGVPGVVQRSGGFFFAAATRCECYSLPETRRPIYCESASST